MGNQSEHQTVTRAKRASQVKVVFGLSERNSSREQTNIMPMRTHPAATDHRTSTNFTSAHGRSVPELT